MSLYVCLTMPGRKFLRKKAPRRRRFIRHRKRRLANRVPIGSSPIAPKHLVRMKYTDVLDWNVTTLATDIQQFNLNSLFDPDVTGTGHQPYGFDQLAALYAHYRVFKCSWHIQFAPSNERLHITVIPINGNASPTSISSAGEQPRGVTKAMSFDGGMPCNFNGSIWLPRLTGATSVQYKTDDRYSAANNASPTEVMRLSILVYNPSGSTVDTSMSITLIYHAEFYDPLTLGPS